MQIMITWLRQKPAVLELHCFLKEGMSGLKLGYDNTKQGPPPHPSRQTLWATINNESTTTEPPSQNANSPGVETQVLVNASQCQTLLSFQPRVTVTSCFVYKVIRD